MSTISPTDVTHAVVEVTIPNYRKLIRAQLPAKVFEPDYANLLWYPVHGAIIAACLWMLHSHYSLWSAPIFALIIGHSMACLGFVAHDIAHGGSIKNLFWRDLFTGIGFSSLGVSPLLWRKWHNSDHHNNTQVRGIDPDHLFTMEHYKHNPVLKFLYQLHPLLRNLVIFSSFAYRLSQQQFRMLGVYLTDPKTKGFEKASMVLQTSVMLGSWIAVTWLLGPQVFWWGFFASMMVTNAIVIAYIATNHFLNPLVDERDVLASSLTVTLPKWLSWLDPIHSYFGAHVAHHLFPTVSGRYTRLIDLKAKELFPDRFHSMNLFKALKLLWKTPWIYDDDVTLIDPVRNEREPTLGHGLENR